MKKRDLKADLELCNKATPGPWEFGPIYAGTIAGELDEERHRANRELLKNFREGWPHAIERAIKAEALAMELVKTLEEVTEVLKDVSSLYGQGLMVANWHFNGELESLDSFFEDGGWLVPEEEVEEVLIKAKEVLGDE